MGSQPTSPAQRRTFLLMIAGGIGGLLALASGWPLLRFLAPVTGAGEGEQITIPRATVAVGVAHFFQFRGKPAVVLQPRPGEYLALSAVCTHLGCVVQWLEAKGEFLCPCHAGRFAPTGAVLGGPPPRPLEALPLVVVADQLRVG
jgi:cytochrome b6-f complex iron-sulfur subunit